MLFSRILNIFFPKQCINCSREEKFICCHCFALIKRNQNPVQEMRNSPLTKLYIPCNYHGNPILARGVHKMKYTFYKDLASELANLFIELFQIEHLPQNTHLVPIPLHKKRQKFRGFNQSRLLAQHVSNQFNWPISEILIRTKVTKSQATLNQRERHKNLHNVFSINGSLPKNTPLLLIDDICTTLSTLTEAAKTLQKNGYTLIFGAALARAQLKNTYANRD